MIAGICWTPFQIINIINYRAQYASDEKIDIYVCLEFYEAESIAIELSKLDYVRKVYTVKDPDYRNTNYLKKKINILVSMINPVYAIKESVCEKIIPSKIKYDYILSTGYLNFNIYFNNYYKRRGSKIIFLDDGVASYLEKKTLFVYSQVYHFFERITGNGAENVMPEKLFVYKPDLVANKNRYREILPLQSLELLPYNIKNDLNNVFKYTELNLNYSLLIFDQLSVGNLNNSNEPYKIQNRILEMFALEFGEEDIIIKLHPRARQTSIYDKFSAFKSNIPWELFLLNQEMDDKIFVSITSTACLTPKLIFDKEPIVIFLYNLIPTEGYEIIDKYIRKVKEIYRDPDKVLIPKTLEELKHALKKIKSINLGY